MRPPLNAPARLYPIIRQRIKCAGAKYCAPTRWCIPSRQRSHPLHAPTATVAERYYPASYRRGFFSAEPAFFSGGEGCEWRAQRATVSREWGYNGENSFSALSPFAGSRKGFCPHIPASRLFILFHPSKAHHPTPKKEHSLLVLSTVNAILNFATKFFDMLTK